MKPSDMPDFSKATLENRIKAFDVLYKDFIQPDIDKKTESLKAASPKHYTNSYIDSNLPKTDYLQPSPAVQNVLDDTFKPKLSLRTKAKLAAAASLVAGMLGTAADAAETAIRFDIARQSNNPLDYLQAGISAATTALGATNVGDVAGVPLELLNGSIGQHREGLPQIRGRSGAKRASK